MKLSVRVRGDWFAVPCKGTEKVLWLGEESLRRYANLKPSNGSSHAGSSKAGSSRAPQEKVYEIRKTRGGALLHGDDTVKSVLDDNDFVSVVLESDRAHPALSKAEIPYVPEQIPGKYTPPTDYITVDGNSLTCEELISLGKGETKIQLSKEAIDNVNAARQLVDGILAENSVVYGITTGFGKFAQTSVTKEELVELQENLIRSHAAGVGPPLTPERTRRLLALRINILAKGHSGISITVINQYIEAFNASCLPWIPEKGTVGASGDLAPMAHIALGMMGEGKMWCPESGWGDARYVLESHGLTPIKLGPKEGLSLINGTQFITSLGVEAVTKAQNVARQADCVAALTLEVLKGTSKAFQSDIQRVRPHHGQVLVARRFRSLLHSDTYPSKIAESHRFCHRVQDAYTLRCIPQVHGIVNDTIEFVHGILTTEMNSAQDNPIVFVDKGEIVSCGNFHGEYPAKALDYLAIGVHEIANMSERRIERLINPAYSGLPAFLVDKGGLNSGFMIAQCTAAALVSENKVLCHPASVDSLSTSAGTEDHVSMGGFSARKCLTVMEHVEQVIAIELLAACQAIEFLRPLQTTAPLEEVYRLVREVAAPWDKDRYMAPDIDAVTDLIRQNKIWKKVHPYVEDYHSKQIMETPVHSPTASFISSAPIASKKKRKRMD